jgi:hypothetical protein
LRFWKLDKSEVWEAHMTFHGKPPIQKPVFRAKGIPNKYRADQKLGLEMKSQELVAQMTRTASYLMHSMCNRDNAAE